MMFADISIKNFRGIEHLDVVGLRNVNVFLGQNNGGKTTLLESVFLLSGMSNPLLPERINSFRDKGISSFDKLKYLFYKMNMSVHPTFVASMYDGSHRELALSMVDKAQRVEDLHNANQIGASSADGAKGETCIVLEYETKRGTSKPLKRKSEFCILNNGQFKQTVNPSYQEVVSARFLSSFSETNVLREEFSNVIRMNKKEEVLSLVRLFDKRISNMENLFDGIYVKYEDIEEMLPLCMCGEGLKKFFNIIVSVVNGKNNILLIDEIDNGVHFSAYNLLWRSLLNLSNRNNVQLFITTHSAEVIGALDSVLHSDEMSNIMKDSLSLYTIARTQEEGMQSYRYGKDDIRQAINNHIELRA